MRSEITISDSTEFFSPPNLQKLCTQYCALNATWLLFNKSPTTPTGSKLKLRKTTVLPAHIWTDVIKHLETDTEDYLPMLWEIGQKVTLTRINVSNCSSLLDKDLEGLMKYYPFSLEIHNCQLLTKNALCIINNYGKNLEILNFGNSTNVLPTDIESWMANHGNKKADGSRVVSGIRSLAQSMTRLFTGGPSTSDVMANNPKPGILQTPNLRMLTVWGHYIHQHQNVRNENPNQNQGGGEGQGNGGGDNNANGRVDVDYWEYLTRDFIKKLEYLDLSGCHEIKSLLFLAGASKSLKYLYLHDVLLENDNSTWDFLKSLTELKFLDLSQPNELASVFPSPDEILEGLVTSLPNLVGLDISGSNLAGYAPPDYERSRINGLKTRQDKSQWFQFLGLMASHYNASGRALIPAYQIAGNATIEQLVVSLKSYINRNNMIRKVVRILHEKIQDPLAGFIPFYTILDLLTDVIKLHVDDKHTLIVSFATLFHALTKIREAEKTLSDTKRDRIFRHTCKAMDIHFQDASLLRNGMLIIHLLCLQMNIPDVMRANTLFPTLLKAGKAALNNNASSSFLLQSIAKHMDTMIDAPKINQVTSVDCISKTCDMVSEMQKKNNAERDIVDRDILSFWRLLLKWLGLAQDETLSKRFIDSKGVEIAFELINMILGEDLANDSPLRDLLIPVVVLLVNLLNNSSAAECHIITSPNIKLVLAALEYNQHYGPEDLKLLYHVCCGFLATITCKKTSLAMNDPSRKELLDKMFTTMKGIEKPTSSFTLKSLKPLYNLLETKNPPEVHFWALRTLLYLFESNEGGRIVAEVENDGKIKLANLRETFVRSGMDSDRKSQIKGVCDSLISIVKKKSSNRR